MDCDGCKKQITAIGEVARSDDAISFAKQFFEGPDYCTAQGSADPEGCKKFVDSFVPNAMPALGYSMGLASDAMCKVVYNLC
jgi:hypothetical protein